MLLVYRCIGRKRYERMILADKLREEIVKDGQLYGLIIRKDFEAEGLTFFTPDEFSQQLAYMKHPQGHIIDPHVHNEVKREVYNTQEVLFIRKGSLRVTFFDSLQNEFAVRDLYDGDVLLLVQGGHGFEMLDECELFEVKQGPYAGDSDKIKFKFKEK